MDYTPNVYKEWGGKHGLQVLGALSVNDAKFTGKTIIISVERGIYMAKS